MRNKKPIRIYVLIRISYFLEIPSCAYGECKYHRKGDEYGEDAEYDLHFFLVFFVKHAKK